MSAEPQIAASKRGPLRPYPRLKTSAWDMFALLGQYWMRRPVNFGLSMLIIVGMVAADIAMPMAAGAMVDRIVEVELVPEPRLST